LFDILDSDVEEKKKKRHIDRGTADILLGWGGADRAAAIGWL
jgi:hypothetical protein